MYAFKPVFVGLCLTAGATAFAAPLPLPLARVAVASWPRVSDRLLDRLRGGMDLNQSGLVGYFAIERAVQVNGQLVAQVQLVISNLDRLAAGGLPTVTVSGPLAQLVQVMNAQGIPSVVSSAGASAAAVLASAAAAPAPALASAVAPAAVAPAAVAPAAVAPAAGAPAAVAPAAVSAVVPTAAPAPQSSGSIGSSGTRTGSIAQFGSALNSAVSAAVGALGSASGGTGSAPAPAASSTSTGAAPSTPVSSVGATPAAAVASSVSAPSSAPSVTVSPPAQITPAVAGGAPLGTGAAPVIVISNLPNATAIATAVQNDVRGAEIQAQTTITATLNSLAALKSLTLASAIQAQVAAAVGR